MTPQHTNADAGPGRAPNPLLGDLITTYNDLNSTVIDELDEEPSALEFMRYVARNTPFVVRGCVPDWEAFRLWDKEFLVDTMRGRKVNVAVTPRGNADAPTQMEDGSLVFAKPHEEDQDFEEFLNYVINQEKNPSSQGSEIRYAQTQNNNLHDEYSPLLPHLPTTIPFARIALGRAPDALNLWIGNSRSVTAMHRDGYENLYVQIRGRKHFVLMPALCAPAVRELRLDPATYRREEGTGKLVLERDVVEGGDEDARVPFPTWDPDGVAVGGREGIEGRGTVEGNVFAEFVQPMRVTLEPGDMLYLPAIWYHKVSQSCSEDDEGFVLAVNYWYDMDYSGPLYPLTNLVRTMSSALQGPK
ncbi:hypothetical protein SAPIO_CDS9655 [Scedosporium apiospermum]|uniref:JmjC domain-containing protein n=1 Tax=Pseudallescheria apiosperma TaxID=563466 RepID=A0A084FX91_PSEDA|nr:uncharacterized protein SAPIO_CDS9655 [Scedosporium apiospermum]KEZ39703.1 hypothetical protein SAPIO_CDS9655 [Scedosporium apiospermum]